WASIWRVLGTGSVADIFQEVDEEVRREQLQKLWQRYGNLIIAGCILIVAADKNAGQIIQDLAAVRAGFLLVDTAPYSEMRERLEPLTAADRTFRHSARELLALSAWKSGDMTAARQWADMIITDPQSPDGTRSRAEVLSELIAAGGKGRT